MKPETSKAKAAWEIYRDMGPDRSLAKVVEAMGSKRGYIQQLKRWSARYDWPGRATRHDHEALREALGERVIVREQVVQSMVERAMRAAEILYTIAEGRVPDGDKEPVLDRHGEVMTMILTDEHGEPKLDEAGEPMRQPVTRPVVKPSTRMEAATRILGNVGIVPPKRMELSGPDQSVLRLGVEVVSKMSDRSLEALAILLEDDEDDAP